jgi:hypothetical protein
MQVVQRFPQLQRIDQDSTGPIVPVQLVQILARDQKRCDAFAVVSDAHLGQVTAAAQKIRSSEDIRGLKTAHVQSNHLLSCFFREDAIEKESRFRGACPSGTLSRPSTETCTVTEVDGLFPAENSFLKNLSSKFIVCYSDICYLSY